MRKKLPAILTLLGAFAAVGGVVLAADLVDPDAEGVSAPYLIAGSRVTPSYPPAAYAAKYAGTVNLRATVNSDGSVGKIEVLDSSRANMGFEDAAMDAVAQWQFEPARKGDTAVDSFSLIRLRFNPPTHGSRGYVASAFGGPGTPSVAGATMTYGKVGGMSQRTTQSKRTAWLPTDARPIQKYGRPPGGIGSVYDRRLLIPPGVGPGRIIQGRD